MIHDNKSYHNFSFLVSL